ncbi:ZIP family metal transporter [Desulfovibrio sp. Huiquan2017]|uniref:ZIP family metal transporter n=1 Tax=Desulfovibrio sp. Huiquan2017 TaxID=2816861 RepID=UPI001A90E70D|nr:ZIP family metal transporter [Desulfovibrio sp. Huiquan2017]
MDWFMEQNAIFQAFLATLFTWGVTALGAALVFTAKDISKKTLDIMLGFAGGVMMAASYWSLLAPALEMSGGMGTWAFVPAAVGFVLGAVFLRLVDMVLPHLHLNAPMSEAEGVKTSWRRSTLLVTAITLHNIPEGLAVGVAFGAVAAGLDSANMAGAISLAMGIGIQNFPEGTAVAVPLRREGMSRMKSFMYGQASGMVEPMAAVLGAAAVLVARPLLPYALAFAAGAMIFVVVEEVIPESQSSGNGDLATMGVVFGFTVMMILDVALG